MKLVKEKTSYDITYTWNLKKIKDINESTCRTETDSQALKTNLWLPKRAGGGVWTGDLRLVYAHCGIWDGLANGDLLFIYFLFFGLFCLYRAAPRARGGSQARGLTGATAAGLRQSHSNIRSKPCLQPKPQLMATPDP